MQYSDSIINSKSKLVKKTEHSIENNFRKNRNRKMISVFLHRVKSFTGMKMSDSFQNINLIRQIINLTLQIISKRV